MSIKLTKKQKQLLNFVTEFTEKNNYSPSYREIAANMGLSSVASVAEHVENLVSIGAIRKIPGTARSLEVVDLSYPETTKLFIEKIQISTDEEIDILKQAAEILNIDLGGL